jgi:hypothetical protein
MPAQITLPIVGIDYPNKKGVTRRFAVDLLAPGDPVELRLEPENPADENAVAVYSVEGVQMGYIPAQRAPYIGKHMRQGGVSAVFQGKGGRGAFLRIAFDDEEPVLPVLQQAEVLDVDWWPDDLPEDDYSQ